MVLLLPSVPWKFHTNVHLTDFSSFTYQNPGYSKAFPYLYLSKKWILGIMAQTLPVVEEFSEIQCSYFASEEKFPPRQTSDRHSVYIELILKDGRDRFNSVPDSVEQFELVSLHLSLCLCPFNWLLWNVDLGNTLEDLWLALVLVRAVRTQVTIKWCCTCLRLSYKVAWFWLVSCRTFENFGSILVQLKFADCRRNIPSCKIRSTTPRLKSGACGVCLKYLRYMITYHNLSRYSRLAKYPAGY